MIKMREVCMWVVGRQADTRVYSRTLEFTANHSQQGEGMSYVGTALMHAFCCLSLLHIYWSSKPNNVRTYVRTYEIRK